MKMNFYENLKHAIGFDANRSYPSLFQNLGYRRRIAEQLMNEINDERVKELTILYERINSEIKTILGL
jgi:hypothetical protein